MSDFDTIDDRTEIELQAAAFRTLRAHLQNRTDVQNIDMMNLAGFCRNCLSGWIQDAATEKGVNAIKGCGQSLCLWHALCAMARTLSNRSDRRAKSRL